MIFLCYCIIRVKKTQMDLCRKEGTAMFIKTVVRNAAANKDRNYETRVNHRLVIQNTCKIAYAEQSAYSGRSVMETLQ